MIKQTQIKLASLIQALQATYEALNSFDTLTGEELKDQLNEYDFLLSDISHELGNIGNFLSDLAQTQGEAIEKKYLKQDGKIWERVVRLHKIHQVNQPDLMEALK